MKGIILVQYAAAKIFTAPKPDLNMASFPALDVLAPVNPAFMTKYDFSKVPSIAVNTPLKNIGPPNCTAIADQSKWGASGPCLWSCGGCLREGDINTCPKKYQFGLSFDDGPAPSTTFILDYLDKVDIRASFFVVGSRVKEHPEILLRTFEAGHQIGIHTWSHRALTTLDTDQIVAELEYTAMAIEQITGTRPTFVRPPFGDHDDRVRAIFKAMGLRIALWDFESNDWRMVNTPEYFPGDSFEQSLLAKAKSQETKSTGLISLHHDLYKAAMDKSPAAFDLVLSTKMVPMSVAECQNDKPYKDTSLVAPPSRSLAKPGQNSSTSGNINPICLFVSFIAIYFFSFMI